MTLIPTYEHQKCNTLQHFSGFCGWYRCPLTTAFGKTGEANTHVPTCGFFGPVLLYHTYKMFDDIHLWGRYMTPYPQTPPLLWIHNNDSISYQCIRKWTTMNKYLNGWLFFHCQMQRFGSRDCIWTCYLVQNITLLWKQDKINRESVWALWSVSIHSCCVFLRSWQSEQCDQVSAWIHKFNICIRKSMRLVVLARWGLQPDVLSNPSPYSWNTKEH